MTVSNISQFILLNKRNVGLSGKFPVTLAEIQGFSGKRGHSSRYLNCSLPFHVINPCNSQLSGTQLLKRMCRYLPIIPVICVPCLCRIPAVAPRVFFHVQSSSSSLHRTQRLHTTSNYEVFPALQTSSSTHRGGAGHTWTRQPLHQHRVTPLLGPESHNRQACCRLSSGS